jgi:hypothetical protein
VGVAVSPRAAKIGPSKRRVVLFIAELEAIVPPRIVADKLEVACHPRHLDEIFVRIEE